jgi:hypothetical protein
MKSSVGIFMLLSSLIIFSNDVSKSIPTKSSHPVTVTQVNAKWNWENNLDLTKLKRCNIQYALLEEQTFSNQSQLKKIPLIFISVEGKVKEIFQGNIMLKPTISLDSLQKIIDKEYEIK